MPFSSWHFEDEPEPGVTTLVTFGVGEHLLVGKYGVERRQELLLSVRPNGLETAVSLAVSIGAYLVDRHVALFEGEVVSMPAELRGSLAHLVVALPEHVDEELARCDDFEPPLEILWLLPFASDESHVPTEHGWRSLIEWLADEGADPYDLSRPSLVQ